MPVLSPRGLRTRLRWRRGGAGPADPPSAADEYVLPLPSAPHCLDNGTNHLFVIVRYVEVRPVEEHAWPSRPTRIRIHAPVGRRRVVLIVGPASSDDERAGEGHRNGHAPACRTGRASSSTERRLGVHLPTPRVSQNTRRGGSWLRHRPVLVGERRPGVCRRRNDDRVPQEEPSTGVAWRVSRGHRRSQSRHPARVVR